MTHGGSIGRIWLVAFVTVSTLVAACTGGSSPGPTAVPATAVPATAAASVAPTEAPAPTSAPQPKKASLQLDWSFLVYHVAFLWGVDKGYYTDEGIDLEVKQGQGSGATNDIVAQGQDTFGFADTYTTVQRVAAGAPVKSVMVIQRKSGFGFACLKSANVTDAKSLEGKKVALVAAESTAAILPAFEAINGIDPSKVTIVDADFSNKVQLLASEQVDCIIGYVAQDTLQAQLLNPNVADAVPWVDYGINLMGHGIIVNPDTIQNDPELIKAFLRATKKSWEEVCASPQAGIDFYLQKFPDLSDLDKQFSQQSLPLECVKNLPKAGDTGAPYGPTVDQQWQQVIDLAKQYGGVTANLTPADVFTNDFLP
jgi:NitT/TauT family transport system substrate-binding protein